MPWARRPWARSAWAARGSGARRAPGEQTLPPPIPGGTGSWTYQPNRRLAWTVRGWASRTPNAVYPGGGISIRPVVEDGVMEVTAWWPDAPLLSLLRIHPDGSIWPVRNANPVPVPGPTRRNHSQNPSYEAGLNGTLPDLGSPALSQVSDGTSPRGEHHLAATIDTAGSCGVILPVDIPPGRDLTIGFDLRLTAMATSVTVQVTWLDAGGSALPVSVGVLTSDDINRSVGLWARQRVQVATPPDGVTATMKIVAAGLPAGVAMELDGHTVERAVTDGSYFDGGTYGAVWTGVEGLSTSALAPVAVVRDGECPVDERVQYKLVNPARNGGAMLSAASRLDSGGRVWLTHPAAPDSPVEIRIEARPRRGKEANQGIFQPIGDPLAVTVAPGRRSGWSSSEDMALWTFDRDETALLWEMLDDNQPMLLRAAAELAFSTGMWISFGSMQEDRDGTAEFQQYMKISGPWVQVSPLAA